MWEGRRGHAALEGAVAQHRSPLRGTAGGVTFASDGLMGPRPACSHVGSLR